MKKNNFVLWLIGLSGSGKTTLAKRIFDKLKEKKKKIEFLDGDEVRKELGDIFGYTKEERMKNIRVLQYIVKKLYTNKINVIVANISPFEELRRNIREKIENYIEIFLDCPLQACIQRDVKKLYKKNCNNSQKLLIGLDIPFEKPTNPDLIIDTSKESIEESEKKILDYLKEKKFI
ncbi:MAG TPA: adenylyl-sulfate kinase [bacterium]|mgnify:CR=1 FL=1|nr:adenylyl-sulfate kinase [bacterium]HPQ19969.1 adenylyl-sulfate kinase [bacterium]